MKESNVYYITRARAIIGKIPQRQELNYIAESTDERAFVERLQKRLGVQHPTQDPILYFREFVGRLALDFSKEKDVGSAMLKAVLLENAKLALLSKVSGYQSSYYTAYGNTVGDEVIRRILSSEDLQRARLGDERVERHVRTAYMAFIALESPEIIVHYFDGAEIRELMKASRDVGTTFEAMAFDVEVCSFVEPVSQDVAKTLYVLGKPKCNSFQEGIELLKRQLGLQPQEKDPGKALLELKRAAHTLSLSEFSRSNVADLYFMLKITEKEIERIKKYYLTGEQALLS